MATSQTVRKDQDEDRNQSQEAKNQPNGVKNQADKTSPISIEKYLKDANYPASKQDLVKCAKDNNAPENVMNILNKMSDKKYNSPVDITKEMKHSDEGNKN